MRRFTRLINGFSKKVENLIASVAIHYMRYNFCRPHLSLKGQTPAQAAGVETRKWSVMDFIGLMLNSKSSN
jgi:transposase InsO family protein